MKKALLHVLVCTVYVPFIKSFQEYSATTPQGILEVQTAVSF